MSIAINPANFDKDASTADPATITLTAVAAAGHKLIIKNACFYVKSTSGADLTISATYDGAKIFEALITLGTNEYYSGDLAGSVSLIKALVAELTFAGPFNNFVVEASKTLSITIALGSGASNEVGGSLSGYDEES